MTPPSHAPWCIETTPGVWMPACVCSWRDPDHKGDHPYATQMSLEHLARCPESWGEPLKGAA